MGPRSRDLLSNLTADDVSNEAFPFGTGKEIDLAFARVRAHRVTYVGELGWELYIPSEFAVGVYDSIVEAGEAFDLSHAGYHAMDSLRLEKAYRHWGHDIGPSDTPLEAGLSFAVAWDKQTNFVGRDALLRQREAGIDRRLCTFVLATRDLPLFHNEPIVSDNSVVGRITSGGYAHTLDAPIGLGYVAVAPRSKSSDILSRTFEIEIAGERVPAIPHLRPPYDPTNQTIRV
jgi:4-methylaminobutanoate oxidase (formaldehyde-forming)